MSLPENRRLRWYGATGSNWLVDVGPFVYEDGIGEVEAQIEGPRFLDGVHSGPEWPIDLGGRLV